MRNQYQRLFKFLSSSWRWQLTWENRKGKSRRVRFQMEEVLVVQEDEMLEILLTLVQSVPIYFSGSQSWKHDYFGCIRLRLLTQPFLGDPWWEKQTRNKFNTLAMVSKIQNMLKVMVFSCQLLYDRVCTRQNLFRRRAIDDPSAPFFMYRTHVWFNIARWLGQVVVFMRGLFGFSKYFQGLGVGVVIMLELALVWKTFYGLY